MPIHNKLIKTAQGYLGSVSGDWNHIKNTASKFGSAEGVSNMFDQRISDGLTDLLAGATGIRTTNIPEITTEAVKAREANRDARAALSSIATFGGARSQHAVVFAKTLKFPERFISESNEPDHLLNYIHFRTLERRNDGDNDQHYNIFLYVPNTLTDGTSIEYDSGKKGILDSIIAKFIAPEGFMASPDQNIAGQALELAKDHFGDLRKAAAGRIVNPLQFQLFKGVGARDFQYSFELYPESPNDSAKIREICYAFKKSSLPGIAPNSANRIYTFPNEWAIRFHGPIKKWMDYPLPSVLKKVTVEHISGNATYNDGAPLGVKLTLDFAEVFELDRVKYDNRVAAQTAEGYKRETSQDRGTYSDLIGSLESGDNYDADLIVVDDDYVAVDARDIELQRQYEIHLAEREAWRNRTGEQKAAQRRETILRQKKPGTAEHASWQRIQDLKAAEDSIARPAATTGTNESVSLHGRNLRRGERF